MNRRNPPSRLVLPVVVDPPDHVCFQVAVPNDRNHIAAFRGAIFRLAKAYTWHNDSAHTAIQVAKVWMDIYDHLVSGCPTPAQGSGGAEVEDLIRQNPDNPCQLQSSVDGLTWCTFADFSKCITGSVPQPPPGGTVPRGECRETDFILAGSDKALLPWPVFTGDTITVTAAKGGWNDGTAWYCPDGSGYILGACSGGGATSSTDPAPSLPHARLLINVGGTFGDGYDTVVNVVGADSGANAFLQMNDSALADNTGSITFHIKYCRASTAPAVGHVIYRMYTPNHPSATNGWLDYVQGTTLTSFAPDGSGNSTHPETFIEFLIGYTQSGGVAVQTNSTKGQQVSTWSDAGSCSVFPTETGDMWGHSDKVYMPSTGSVFVKPVTGDCLQAIACRSGCQFTCSLTTAAICP